VSPTLDRAGKDRLANLADAGRLDHALVPLRLQACGVPVEAGERDQAPCLRLAIVDQPLVLQAVGRQYHAPVVHQAGLLPVVESQVRLATGELEQGRIDRQACVDGIAPCQNPYAEVLAARQTAIRIGVRKGSKVARTGSARKTDSPDPALIGHN
jgi:hypothetical protein